jgi:hypothetical protein
MSVERLALGLLESGRVWLSSGMVMKWGRTVCWLTRWLGIGRLRRDIPDGRPGEKVMLEVLYSEPLAFKLDAGIARVDARESAGMIVLLFVSRVSEGLVQVAWSAGISGCAMCTYAFLIFRLSYHWTR